MLSRMICGPQIDTTDLNDGRLRTAGLMETSTSHGTKGLISLPQPIGILARKMSWAWRELVRKKQIALELRTLTAGECRCWIVKFELQEISGGHKVMA
jgi:hypothetical protein